MEKIMTTSNSKICVVSIGGKDASEFLAIAAVDSISMSYGDVLDGITINE